jgi:hypothetical protein
MKKIINTVALVFVALYSSFIYSQTFKPIGPFNRTGPGSSASGQGSGIVSTITFHPKYNQLDASIGNVINKTIFSASRYGGIWISRDNGGTWANSDPLNQYTNLSTDFVGGAGVTDVVIDYNNPTTLYAAISGGGPSKTYTSVLVGNYATSKGIYKYTPSTGWVVKLAHTYGSNKAVMQLAIDPVNPNILFAATSDGILRSIDGGTTWTTVLTAGTEKPFRNVVFNPTNPSEVYACGQEVFKSTNGGVNWTSISNFSASLPAGDVTSLVNVAVISSTSIYATIVSTNTSSGGRSETFRHFDGNSWSSLPIFPIGALEYHYDRLPLIAKKVGAIEYVYAGSEITNIYNSSTNSWQAFSSYNQGGTHADIHEIVFAPDGSSLWLGHDGGISYATANFYDSPNWTVANNGLNISTIYSFSGSETNPQLLVTGEQDNGNSYVLNADENNLNTITWQGFQICDGGDKMIDRTNEKNWFVRDEMYGGKPIYRYPNVTLGTHNIFDQNETQIYIPGSMVPTGWAANGVAAYVEMNEGFGEVKPLVQDPNYPNIIYRGANILLRSSDYGTTSQRIFRGGNLPNTGFYSNITSIAIAQTNSNYLYVISTNGHILDPTISDRIFKTTNALTCPYLDANYNCSVPNTPGCDCSCWTDITPTFPVGLPQIKETRITSIVVSDKDPNRVWASFGYSANTSNYKVWMYDGTTWSDWGAGLPSMSITYLVYEKGSNDALYAGTDAGGVYYRNKSMSAWVPFGNLPHAEVRKMEINYTENTLRVGTWGRGIWKTNLYCPISSLTKTNCTNCNSATDYFWEGANVTISNTTLTANTLAIRATGVIDLLPNTVLEPTINSTISYDVFIHGCGPGNGNSYKKLTDPTNQEDIIEKIEEAKELTIYPNPNNGAFTLVLNPKTEANSEEEEEEREFEEMQMDTNNETADVCVYNMLGDIVYQQKVPTSTNEISLNMESNKSGIYLIRVIKDGKTKTVKFIKQ